MVAAWVNTKADASSSSSLSSSSSSSSSAAAAAAAKSLLDTIGSRKVVLCAGPGGVGKTTVSAAIALEAARAGRRVLVLTIDPARRLADALGVALDNEPRRIDHALLQSQGLEVKGELWALMLDASRTFDDLFRDVAPCAEVAARMLDNLVYRQISRALAGAVEYAAIEKLHDVRLRHDFDLIVVDTPPSKNILDFLEAPQWIARFLDDRIIRWFLAIDPTQEAGGFRHRLLQRTGRLIWEVLSHIFGKQLLDEIVGFMRAIESMTTQLRVRAEQVDALLRSSDCMFLVVATPSRSVLGQAEFLRAEITRRHTPFGGFVVNRTHAASGVDARVENAAAAAQAIATQAMAVQDAVGAVAGGDARLAEKLLAICAAMDQRARHDSEAVEHLRRMSGWEGFVATLPRELGDISDLAALNRLTQHLRA